MSQVSITYTNVNKYELKKFMLEKSPIRNQKWKKKSSHNICAKMKGSLIPDLGFVSCKKRLMVDSQQHKMAVHGHIWRTALRAP